MPSLCVTSTRVAALLLVGASVLLGACRSSPDAGDDPARVESPSGSPGNASAPATFLAVLAHDGRTGQRLSWNDLVDRAAAAHVVIIAEEHDLDPAQMMAADLFAAVLERRPNAAVALEFYERDQQVHLDDYLAGLTTTEQFVAATGRRAGNDPAGHRAMVEAAKAAGVPAIAANAPRRYVRLARTDGYDRLRELTPEQQRLFNIPDPMPSGGYHERFITLMTGMGDHSAPPASSGPAQPDEQRIAQAEAIFRSQATWDATMADSVVRASREHRPVFLVIGRFHTDNDGGTLQLIRRARPNLRVLTISCGRGLHPTLLETDRNRADIVVYADDPPAAPDAPEGASESDAGN
ncbi:MAG: ChaN family lipoprotein [Phycisphaeraceae bacterium]|nr:ChaN family lipoprotein [Phycisphaeraceae bacterium]